MGKSGGSMRNSGDKNTYSVLLVYMSTYILVKSSNFSKFPKSAYILVKKIRSLRRHVFHNYHIVNDGKVVVKRVKELWPAAGAFFAQFVSNYHDFLFRIHHLRTRNPIFSPAAHHFISIYTSKLFKIFKIFQASIYTSQHIY